jgi:hypothetical protein
MSLGYRKTMMRAFLVKTKIEPLRLHAILPRNVEDAKKVLMEYIEEHPRCKAEQPCQVVELLLADFEAYEEEHSGKCLDLREKAMKTQSQSLSSDEEIVVKTKKQAGQPSEVKKRKPTYEELEQEVKILRARIAAQETDE